MTDIKLSADFAQRYGPRALILGGSEGIGAAFAHALAAEGFELTLVARSAGPLEATAADIRKQHGVAVSRQPMDLTDPDLSRSVAELMSRQDFGLVIYNAGATHGVGLFLDNPVDHARNLVRLNCDGPVLFAHLSLSAMRKRGRGGLILVSSMSALAGSGYVAAYAASKSFELVLAEGLHWELGREGIDVMCAVASLTDTPAMQRAGIVAGAGPTPMTSEDVAVGALRYLGQGPVWYAAGDQVVDAMRAAPRTMLTENASRMSAEMWGIDSANVIPPVDHKAPPPSEPGSRPPG
jgi:uncharacterized protein